jgi:FkbM family methyltransferase
MLALADLMHLVRPTPRRVQEQRWADRVERYREVREAGPPKNTPDVARHQVGGLTWYVPHPDLGLGRLMARSQQLPAIFEIEQSHRLGARGDTMIDIGANIGTTSIPRVKMGHFRRAYVAEPERLDYTCLVHNVVANSAQGLVLPDNCAIYSFSGSVKFREQAQSGVHRVNLKDKGRDVPCFTLDDWIERCGADPRRVHFIKCDAQGAEGHIFRGAESLLTLRRALWQIEYWPRGLSALGTTEAELQALVASWFSDFAILGRRGDGKNVETVRPIGELGPAITALQLGARGFTNLLLYPTSLAAIRGLSS